MTNIEKLYLSALRESLKAARTQSSGKRLTPIERGTARYNANKSFEKKISASRKAWAKGRWDNEILEGMARGVFASAWADRQEERGRSFSQQDIYDIAPKTPPKAKSWAKVEAARLIQNNNISSLTALYDDAQSHGYPRDAQHFGFHVGMRLVGHGVSPQDDMRGKWDYKSHHTEFNL